MIKMQPSTWSIKLVVLLLILLHVTHNQACHATCLLCDLASSANNCTACDSALFRSQTVSPSPCSCIVGYIDAADTTLNPTCISGQCSYTCSGQCQGTAAACTACNGGNFRTLTGSTCPCDLGYFDNGVQLCVACNSKCKSCVTAATTCTDCYSTQFRAISGSSCNCISAYFDAGIDVCGACSYKCSTCSGASTTCTACAGGATRTTTPACACAAKYYDDGFSASCVACDYSCATCNDGNSCATCNSVKFRVYSFATSMCACKNGYYDTGLSAELCGTCYANCQTCTGTASTNCLSCYTANHRTFNSGTGKCDCSPGYYASSTTACAACHATCQTCSGALITNCLTCNSAVHRTTLTSNSCPCDTGYYSGSNFVCTACHSSCLTCASGLACATCPSATQIVDSVTGYCTCATTKYWDSTSSTCVNCAATCSTCSIAGTNCTSCSMTTNKRVLSNNVCVCAVGYYDSGATICTACSYTCLACDATGCLTCNTTAKRTKVGTTCICQQGSYDDGTNQLCKTCKNTCLTCVTSSTNCQTCDGSTKFRVLSGSNCNCLPGYYDPNSGSPVCNKCSNKCATCSTSFGNCGTCAGTLSTRGATPGCLCNAKYYDDGVSADCVACQYTCKTCAAGTSCLTCDSTKFRYTNPLTGYCGCAVRYYDDGTNQLCVACHQTCLTCTGTASTTCLTCNAASQRVFNSGTSACDCKPKYYATSATVQLCAACHATCLTCTGATITSCVTCSASQQRTFDGTNKCLCVSGFYLDTTSFVCQSCHSSCATCASFSACSTCPYATQIINAVTGICQCSTVTAWDAGSLSCIACHYSCATCSLVTTNCTSCNTVTDFRTISATTCPCLAGYYDNSVAICATCSYKCATCDVTGCLTCDSNAPRTISGTTCNCNNGYYDDGSHTACALCHHSCKTCSASTACTACQPLLFRQPDAGNIFCSCFTKYYESATSLNCMPCLYSCATCSVGDRCVTCTAANFRFFNTSTTQCECNVRYYDDGSHQLCNPCLYDCLTCTDFSSCSTCDLTTDKRSYNSATTRCDCTTRYYETTSTVPPTCASCHYSCLTCTSNTATTCVTCNSAAERVKNIATGKCDCRASYYDDGSHQQCVRCHYSCQTCSAAGACLTCDAGTLRTLSTTCVCPTLTYYDDGANYYCLPCQYSCSTCTGPQSCTTCDAVTNFRRTSLTTTYCDCLDGYYDDGYFNQLCVLCPYPCLTCNNPSVCLTCDSGTNHRYHPQNKCLCMDGFYDDGANHVLCATCQYTCQTCIVGNQCLTCNSLKMRVYNPTTNYCDCISGYYDTGVSAELCQICHYSCLTCVTSQTHCTSCNATYYRTLNSGASTCPCDTYYYDDLVNPLCLSCHYSCLTCSSPTTCITCDPLKHRQYDPSNDRCKCSIRYYDDGNNNQMCNSCHGSCLQCTDSTACTACDGSMLRLRNYTANYAGIVSPYCICNYKYYSQANLQAICLPCHYTCAVCSAGTSTSCLFCTADAHRALNSTSHTCPCINGYFDNLTSTQTCLVCHPWCTTCTNSTTTACTACASPYFLKLDVTTCFQVCPTYFFGQLSTMKCKPCSTHCQTCANASYCTLCDTGFPLYQAQCLTSCPVQSTYLDVANNKCIDCPAGCLTCTSSINCQSCVSIGYYLDAQLHLCFKCNQYCKGCFGPAQNQCLDCNYPLYFSNNQCFNISCPYGQYIDSHLGCQDCKNIFTNSLTCTINQATLCQKLYIVKSGICTYCTQVTGYTITNTGDCSQICGDGILINYQCDDGNNLSGDGCSSNCLSEQGWHCTVNSSMTSVCSIDGTIQMTLKRIFKYGGQNKVKLDIGLSMPIRLNGIFFGLNIAGTSAYTWQFTQSQTDLTSIWFIIKYSESIDNKLITFSYNTSLASSQPYASLRLLQSSSISLVFSDTFTVSSYPPANYYSDQQINSLTYLKNIIYSCSIVLLCLCALNFIFPRKMYIHLFLSACLPAQIFIYFGLAAQDYTDWIKWALTGMDKLAFIGGFKVGIDDLTVTQHFGYSRQITINMGITGCIMLGLWLIYAFLSLVKKYPCKHNQHIGKINMYMRYFILTLQFCLLPHMAYSAINALYHSSLTSQTSTINVCLAIFINIYLLGIISIVFMLSKYTKANQLMILSQIQQKRINQGHQGLSVQDNVSDQNKRRYRQFNDSKKMFYPQLDKDNTVNNTANKLRVFDTDDNHNDRSDRQTQKIQFQSSRSQLHILDQYRNGNRDNNKSRDSSRNAINNQQKAIVKTQEVEQYDAIGYWYNNIEVYRKIQKNYLLQWLIYDYVQLYKAGQQQQSVSYKSSLSQPLQQADRPVSSSQIVRSDKDNETTCRKYSYTRYYLASTILKLYLLSLVSSVVQSKPFILYLVLGGISIIYIVYIIIIRPFRLMFSNIRVILGEIGIAICCGIMAYYMYRQNYGLDYQQQVQKALLSIIAALLIGSIVLIILQTIAAWRMEIWNKLQPCLVAMRLRGARKVLSYRKNKPKPKPVSNQVQPKKEQQKEEEMDAFFARMLNKQAIQKQYRRERMLKGPRPVAG